MTAKHRLTPCYSHLAAAQKTAFIPFIKAGDPTLATAQEFFTKLPASGADIIEIGVPFSDPVADGAIIEAAGKRALQNTMSLKKVLEMVEEFRQANDHTPIVLMGYFNPIYRYGVAKFSLDAEKAGVDGVIIVDLPPEEEAEVTPSLAEHGIDLIRLIAPTSSVDRQHYITQHASGFVYYISVKGITGGISATHSDLETAIQQLRQQTTLPIAAGFGIKTPAQAAQAASLADAVVVGSALVQTLYAEGLEAALSLAKNLANAIHQRQV
jgi:tryptophan synthase alpha chain